MRSVFVSYWLTVDFFNTLFENVLNRAAPNKTKRVKHDLQSNWFTKEIDEAGKKRDFYKKSNVMDNYKFWMMDGWVRVLRPFNSISVILRRWKGEHERLCAMKRSLGSGRISLSAGFEPAIPWSKVTNFRGIKQNSDVAVQKIALLQLSKQKQKKS